MSWSSSGQVDQKATVSVPDQMATLKDYPQQGYGEEESKLAIIAAKALAVQGITQGLVGDGKVNVSLAGHANPNHTSDGHWANDYISVSLTQFKES